MGKIFLELEAHQCRVCRLRAVDTHIATCSNNLWQSCLLQVFTSVANRDLWLADQHRANVFQSGKTVFRVFSPCLTFSVTSFAVNLFVGYDWITFLWCHFLCWNFPTANPGLLFKFLYFYTRHALNCFWLNSVFFLSCSKVAVANVNSMTWRVTLL